VIKFVNIYLILYMFILCWKYPNVLVVLIKLRHSGKHSTCITYSSLKCVMVGCTSAYASRWFIVSCCTLLSCLAAFLILPVIRSTVKAHYRHITVWYPTKIYQKPTGNCWSIIFQVGDIRQDLAVHKIKKLKQKQQCRLTTVTSVWTKY